MALGKGGTKSKNVPDDPPRPLGAPGRRIWERYAGLPADDVAIAAELADEHYMLRARVLKDGDPGDRRALRDIETALDNRLRQLDLARDWIDYEAAR